jgi:hypothetical protein
VRDFVRDRCEALIQEFFSNFRIVIGHTVEQIEDIPPVIWPVFLYQNISFRNISVAQLPPNRFKDLQEAAREGFRNRETEAYR